MDWEGPTCYAVVDHIDDNIPDLEETGVPRSSLRVNIDYEWREDKLFYWVETYPGSEDHDPEEDFIVSDSLELYENGLGEDIEDLLMGTVEDEFDIPVMVNGKVVNNKPDVDAFSDYEYTGDIHLHPKDESGFV